KERVAIGFVPETILNKVHQEGTSNYSGRRAGDKTKRNLTCERVIRRDHFYDGSLKKKIIVERNHDTYENRGGHDGCPLCELDGSSSFHKLIFEMKLPDSALVTKIRKSCRWNLPVAKWLVCLSHVAFAKTDKGMKLSRTPTLLFCILYELSI